MTAQVFGDDDADLELLQDRNVAVLGYDDDARAHALCLRDSGVDVRVGLDPKSPLGLAAEDDGLRVVSAYEACEEADLFVLLGLEMDDPVVPEVVLPNLVSSDVVVLGAQGSLSVEPPPGVDIVRIVPWQDGAAVRAEYAQGRGVAMFASVVVDGSGDAREIALSYARAIGGTRAGVIVTGEDEYQSTAQQGQTLLKHDLLRHVRMAFDAAVAEGSSPELAYVLCIQSVEPFARGINEGRFDSDLAASGVTAAPDAAASFEAAARAVRALAGEPALRRRSLD